VIQRDDLLALLALRLSCASSAELAARLREAPAPRELANEAGWRPRPRDWHEARRQLVATMAVGLDVVPVWELPDSLTRAAWSPPLLFVRGAACVLHREAIAVVGARRASADAVEWAAARAREASERDYVVVSGGARGVDAAAHRAALRAGVPTVAYLGVAADRIYPASNRELFARVLRAGGALVSEHPPGAETFRSGHATRNRFIAAHARAVLVAEAGLRSGTLSTVAFARRAGVPVWVSPDDVGRERAGLNQVLAGGAAGIWPGWARAELDR
jgi:DNA protecting protein DprA